MASNTRLGGLAELEIGGVEQALLVVLVEQALGRDEFEDLDASSRVQPCEAAPSRNSSSVSERVM